MLEDIRGLKTVNEIWSPPDPDYEMEEAGTSRIAANVFVAT
jgi:hypothetical protein